MILSQELCQTAAQREEAVGWGRGEGVRLSFAQDPFVKMDGMCFGVVVAGVRGGGFPAKAGLWEGGQCGVLGTLQCERG